MGASRGQAALKKATVRQTEAGYVCVNSSPRITSPIRPSPPLV